MERQTATERLKDLLEYLNQTNPETEHGHALTAFALVASMDVLCETLDDITDRALGTWMEFDDA